MKRNPKSIVDLKSKDELKDSKSISTIFNTSQTVAHVENLDMKEINFNQSKKDLTEAKIHHLLSEEMAKPQKNFRKLSYSRHQLEDDDPKISYKVHTQVRRMMSEKDKERKL
eukprot:TRINITY_DN17376_c0_g1_i1.p2 TRINITY_DN17376_c0_g1~~TRINITY_DN17376_c0_g1_i1.p2  ORF type:complete len:112 (-),score=22.39 TRINITY_DN17376_c0_g1_i1:446-781(-)